MNETQKKDVENGTDAFLLFAKQLKADTPYGKIILEELLKTLLGVKDEEKNA